MNSKTLVLNALQNKEVERVPFVPFVGCHGARLIGVDCEEYFKDEDDIVKGVKKAYELYRPDGLIVLFDLQLEAEALGCKLMYSKINPPSVVSHPLANGKDFSDMKIPTESDGRFPVVLEATKRICSTLGDKIAVYGLITGPFTLALHLKGTEIFYSMMEKPEDVKKLMKFCMEVCINTAKMYMDAGVDIIAVVDPMISQISQIDFEMFVSNYMVSIFKYIKLRGKSSSYFVCGDALRNIETMCKCKPDNISIDENVPLGYVKNICNRYGVSISGNLKLTETMLFGTIMDNINDAKNCLKIGGKKGYILSPGCDIPFDTPIENIKAIASVVYGEAGDFSGEQGSLEGIEVELPDYQNGSKVYIEIITLDSDLCATCKYNVESVKLSVRGLEDKVIWREYKVKEKESVVRMKKLGIKKFPTICIDGEAKFINFIPSVEDLRESIIRAIDKKGL